MTELLLNTDKLQTDLEHALHEGPTSLRKFKDSVEEKRHKLENESLDVLAEDRGDSRCNNVWHFQNGYLPDAFEQPLDQNFLNNFAAASRESQAALRKIECDAESKLDTMLATHDHDIR